MDPIYWKVKHSDRAAIALAMLAAVVILAGFAIPAQAQNHPPAFFPYPSTFEINGIVNYGNLLGRSGRRCGRLQRRRQTRRRLRHGWRMGN